jgi:hypothetical protein
MARRRGTTPRPFTSDPPALLEHEELPRPRRDLRRRVGVRRLATGSLLLRRRGRNGGGVPGTSG